MLHYHEKPLTRNSDSFSFPEESPETGILNRLFDFVKENINLYKEYYL
jgi:hypothetical protein